MKKKKRENRKREQPMAKPRKKPPVLSLEWQVLERVMTTIGRLRAESGGAIGAKADDTPVSHYHFDESSSNSCVTYSPDYEELNGLFKNTWNPIGVRLRGFVHSHPGRMSRPSHGDEMYAMRILDSIDDLACLWLPIINTFPDTGEFRLTPWVVYRSASGVSVVRGQVLVNAPVTSHLEISGRPVPESIRTEQLLDEIVVEPSTCVAHKGQWAHLPSNKQGLPKDPQLTFDTRNTFNRVRDAYDPSLMHGGRIVAVGTGGAASWLEDLARSGIGQFVLIDPDFVAETNLATQQTYRRDIGRPKVDCIAERIRDINPVSQIVALQHSLDDLTDEEVRLLSLDTINGSETIGSVLCGLTDSFFAQARINRLALHLGVPSLCAQVYEEGRGAEITFTYPGVTPACHRCVLSSRYEYFLEKGLENGVTSHGTPIFSTTRLNAIKGYLTLAMLHHGSAHPRWGNMLSRIGRRNLIQVRMDPDLAETMNMNIFDRVFEGADRTRLFFDEVVWLPQEQECQETGYAPCPDCGGTVDLRDAIGRFADTRLKSRIEQATGPLTSEASATAQLAMAPRKEGEGLL